MKPYIYSALWKPFTATVYSIHHHPPIHNTFIASTATITVLTLQPLGKRVAEGGGWPSGAGGRGGWVTEGAGGRGIGWGDNVYTAVGSSPAPSAARGALQLSCCEGGLILVGRFST